METADRLTGVWEKGKNRQSTEFCKGNQTILPKDTVVDTCPYTESYRWYHNKN